MMIHEKPEEITAIGSALPIVFESFQSVEKDDWEQAASNKPKPFPPEEASAVALAPVADDADDLVSLSLGTTRTNNGGGGRKKGGHERSSSSSGTAGDDSQLSLGLGFSRPSTTTDDEKAGPVLNLSSDSSGSADDTANKHAGESRKSPSGGGGDNDEVQQQAKKTRVSVRVKCDTPTVRVNNCFRSDVISDKHDVQQLSLN
ncbi:hypothetical protein PR202_gb20674 [Eleusine coracana subsp. coracana]|uniref:Uncharacterized protein n=1 Tax=Eleusine coracana subsp. coracana TaxID=191504 RepID=A0AAV5FD41_ELECO|nr:hypothetical protein PR202_gb20674 [Eleusine coracana subsp. coracana]